jgi:hypothetical protein
MLFREIRISLFTILTIWCDNVSALALASNPVYHARTKHIKVDYHFVREKVLNRDIALKFISTHDQIADVFTKGLSFARFLFLKSKLLVLASLISLRGDVKLTHHTQSAPADSGNQSSTEYPPATAMTTKAIFHTRQVIDNLERSPDSISRTTQSSLGKEVNKERKKFFLPKTCCCRHI